MDPHTETRPPMFINPMTVVLISPPTYTNGLNRYNKYPVLTLSK